MDGVRHHYNGLIKLRIRIGGNEPVLSPAFDFGSERVGQCHKASLRVAGFDKLRGLRDILSHHQAIGNFVIDAIVLQYGDGGASIGSLGGIGNCNLLHRGIEQNVDSVFFGEKHKVCRHPEDHAANGIAIECGTIRIAALHQPRREVRVGGEKNVKGSTVFNLLRERTRRPERKLHLDARFFLVGLGNFFQRAGEIGRGRDGHLSRRDRRLRSRQPSERRQQQTNAG